MRPAGEIPVTDGGGQADGLPVIGEAPVVSRKRGYHFLATTAGTVMETSIVGKADVKCAFIQAFRYNLDENVLKIH
jgi:hypothetical protein